MTEAAVAVERAKLLLETLVEDLVATLAQEHGLALFTRRITAASAGEGSTGGHQCCGHVSYLPLGLEHYPLGSKPRSGLALQLLLDWCSRASSTRALKSSYPTALVTASIRLKATESWLPEVSLQLPCAPTPEIPNL